MARGLGDLSSYRSHLANLPGYPTFLHRGRVDFGVHGELPRWLDLRHSVFRFSLDARPVLLDHPFANMAADDAIKASVAKALSEGVDTRRRWRDLLLFWKGRAAKLGQKEPELQEAMPAAGSPRVLVGQRLPQRRGADQAPRRRLPCCGSLTRHRRFPTQARKEEVPLEELCRHPRAWRHLVVSSLGVSRDTALDMPVTEITPQGAQFGLVAWALSRGFGRRAGPLAAIQEVGHSTRGQRLLCNQPPSATRSTWAASMWSSIWHAFCQP